MDISTFRSYYYIDKIYRFIDHFAKFMNSSWENFKNINIVFPSLFLSFFKFSFFPSQNGRLMDEKKKKIENEIQTNTLHIFSFLDSKSYFQRTANSNLPFHHALSLQI